MGTTNRIRTGEKRNLADLIDHPLQSSYFDALSDHELRALADDIGRNGLKNLIEILPANAAGLPANTIIDGHQRRRVWCFAARRR